MKIMWNRGPIPKALPELLATVQPATYEDANQFHRAVGAALIRANFKVRREHPMPYGDRAGRIDLHAHRPDVGNLWIELDRTSPRTGSIRKLNNAVDSLGGVAVVVCRTPRRRRP